MRYLRLCCALGLALGLASCATALPLRLNLQLTAPDQPENVLTLTASTILGSNTQQSILTGAVVADVEVELEATSAQASELTFTGGTVFASDVTFSLLGGLLTATGTGLAASPSTPAPPGLVTMAEFDAAEHLLTINRGMVSALGNVFDFSQEPLDVVGTGIGTLQVLSAGPPVGNDYSYFVQLRLPVETSSIITVPNVPIFGSIDVTLTGSGMVVAEEEFTVTIPDGDLDFNTRLDCEDSRLLGEAIAAGSTDPVFDLNRDGAINGADYVFWIEQLKATLPGDVNLDFVVDASDFNQWNAHKFTFAAGICSGDLNGDSVVDLSDFNIWNEHKFLAADAPSHVVPEPAAAVLVGGLALSGLWFAGRRI